MKRTFLILILGFLLIPKSWAIDLYNASTISNSLKEKADAVIRLQEVVFNIEGIDAATYQIKNITTILNKAGDKFAPIYLGYDRQRKVKSLEANVYDAQGNIIKKVKSKDFEDFSAFSGSLYEDNRIKYFEYVPLKYPYTIEYTYEIFFDGLLHYPDWQPQIAPSVAVEKSTFTVKTPSNLDFRFKEQHITESVKHGMDGDTKVYQWVVSNMKTVRDESLSPDFSELTTIVFTAPIDFKFEGYAGNMETWENFGVWINMLNEERDQLSATTVAKVKDMVKDIPDPKEKVRKLYEYLQSKTRYVSIQLGIGGYQPFEADMVDRLGYGDCKALTNYMQTLLKSVGINSNYTLVRAGRQAKTIQSDFPSTQFNHVILCVPMEKDTVWLECTSQTYPFGYLGSFTSNRDVLMIKQGGAEIVHTPTYSQDQNTQIRKAEVAIDENGNGTATVETVYSGLQYENVARILQDGYEEQKKAIYQKTDIPTFDLNDFSYTVDKNSIPSASEKLNISLRNYANISGKRVFFSPNLMNKSSFTLPKNEERKSEIVRKTPYIDIDSIVFKIPENLHTEFMPEAIKFQSEFGTYEASFQAEQGNIIYYRKITVRRGRFSPDQYDELCNFYQEINKADRTKIVLRKST